MSYPITERGSGLYSVTLKKETGAPVPASQLDSLTLTLYDQKTKAIINGRNAQNVLNLNGVTMSELGVLTWAVTPADTAIVGSASTTTTTRVNGELVLGIEDHIALFQATWNSGAKAFNWQFTMNVVNLDQLP